MHLSTQNCSYSMLMVPQLHWLILLCQLGGWIMVLISRSLLWLWFVLRCVSDLYFRVIHCWRRSGCCSQSSANRKAPHSTHSVAAHDWNMFRICESSTTFEHKFLTERKYIFTLHVLIKTIGTLQCVFSLFAYFHSKCIFIHSLQVFYFKHLMNNTENATLNQFGFSLINYSQGTTHMDTP